jgi:hypothetical protein
VDLRVKLVECVRIADGLEDAGCVVEAVVAERKVLTSDTAGRQVERAGQCGHAADGQPQQQGRQAAFGEHLEFLGHGASVSEAGILVG